MHIHIMIDRYAVYSESARLFVQHFITPG